jgi:hypothetical protein
MYGPRGAITEVLEELQDRVTDILTGASTPSALRSSVASSDARVLLITAGTVPTDGHAAEHIASGASDRVDIWTVEGAGHTDGRETQPRAWARRVVTFLDRTLVQSR